MKGYYSSGQPISSWDEVRAEIESEARSKRSRPTEEGVVMGSGFEI